MTMIKHYLDLYWMFLAQRFKILMEYRINFLIGATSTIFMQTASILAIWVVMRQVPDLNGWALEEIWLIYGLITLAQSLNHMFADNLWTLGWNYVRTGGFDGPASELWEYESPRRTFFFVDERGSGEYWLRG